MSIDIDRPPEDVFAFLTNVDRMPEWQGSAVSATSDGPVGKGARISQTRQFRGRELQIVQEVTEYDPPHRFDIRSVEGPIPFSVSHTLEPSGGGTRLEVVSEAKPKGVMRLAAGGVAKALEADVRRDFQRLKELLESS